MLTRMLTAVVLAPIPQVPAPPCTLAGPPVEARWSGAIPPASTAEAPLRVVADVPPPGSASRFDSEPRARIRATVHLPHGGRAACRFRRTRRTRHRQSRRVSHGDW